MPFRSLLTGSGCLSEETPRSILDGGASRLVALRLTTLERALWFRAPGLIVKNCTDICYGRMMIFATAFGRSAQIEAPDLRLL